LKRGGKTKTIGTDVKDGRNLWAKPTLPKKKRNGGGKKTMTSVHLAVRTQSAHRGERVDKRGGVFGRGCYWQANDEKKKKRPRRSGKRGKQLKFPGDRKFKFNIKNRALKDQRNKGGMEMHIQPSKNVQEHEARESTGEGEISKKTLFRGKNR